MARQLILCACGGERADELVTNVPRRKKERKSQNEKGAIMTSRKVSPQNFFPYSSLSLTMAEELFALSRKLFA